MKHVRVNIKKSSLSWYIFSLVFLLITYFFLYKILIPRILAFGCFDDCFNFMGGYFLLKGKHLYSEVFYNHQPLAACISFFIQKFKHPQNIYELVLIHRQFLLLFSFFMNFLLLVRFRYPAIGFILMYEFTKFYLFGDRFLAESFIVYPLVYLFGVVLLKLNHHKLSLFDFIFSAICTWFVIFMREPYILLSIVIFTIILWGKPFSQEKKAASVVFILLIFLTLLQFPLKDYFFSVVTINQQTVLHSETTGIFSNPMNLLQILMYPLFIFLTGNWNLFREILICVDVVFFISVFLNLRSKTFSKTPLAILFIILALANVRTTSPGVVFYEGFHVVVWYSLFIFATWYLSSALFAKQKKVTFVLYGVLIGIVGFSLFSGSSYTHDYVDLQKDLLTNYGKELQVGEVVRKLSKPTDTLFLDGFDDLIYWQADRISPYTYSWYTSFMHSIPVYQKAKQTMFATTPPDFYYGSCIENIPYWEMPQNAKKLYVRLYTGSKPSCLYVNKQKVSKITKEQWKAAAEFGYTLHEY